MSNIYSLTETLSLPTPSNNDNYNHSTIIMCTQVDYLWTCGHQGYYETDRCKLFLNGCLGPGPLHRVLPMKEKCSDCKTRDMISQITPNQGSMA